MKQIGEPRKVTAPNALGKNSTCWHTTYEIEASDVNVVRENYLGFRHRSLKLTHEDVGRTIIVMTDGTGWTCWSFHAPVHPDTYRTKCGRGRTTYHPEWSESQPWATYIDGTAGRHVVDLPAAHAYFESKGMELIGNKQDERGGS